MNVDGSDLHSWSSEGSDYGPVFSPDIKIIIFARSEYYGDLKVSAAARAWLDSAIEKGAADLDYSAVVATIAGEKPDS